MDRGHLRRRILRALLASLLLVSGAAAAEAQQAADSPLVILGTVAADPGTNATIPLYFKPKAGQALQGLHLEVVFVSNSVKFAKSEKGVASEMQNVELKLVPAELGAEGNIRRTRLDIDVSVSGGAPDVSLPEGLLAFLDFRVPTDAKAFSIALNPQAVAGRDADGKPVALSAEAGKIIVSVPDAPMVGCFFFTH
jgi:hypothetical protein